VPRGRHDNFGTTFGRSAPPPKIWEGKNVQNLARFRTTSNFDRVYISGTGQDIDKRKTALSTIISPTFEEKYLVNFGTLATELARPRFTHPTATFSQGHIFALRGAVLLKFFTHAREWQKHANPHLTGDGGPTTIF